MKKLLLASVAAGTIAMAAAPAQAEIELTTGGYFKGYGVFLDSDDGASKDFDFIRNTEIHVGGETTLDNGLVVGAHFEFEVDGQDSSNINESYVYFSGNWGRVNFGNENGAAYLLQVAAPSADSNIDGIRQYVRPSNVIGTLDYDDDITGKQDKLTYLSPIVSGFQIGASFTADGTDDANESIGTDNGSFEKGYEAAIRYEGQFQNVGVIAGAGYSLAENDNGVVTQDDADSWNVGLDLDIAAFGIGAVYVSEENTTNVESDTMVVGVDYTTGPFKIGASYFDKEDDATGTANDVDTTRYSGGVTYEYGPGMTFRGSVHFTEEDAAGSANDIDETAVVLGTQINF